MALSDNLKRYRKESGMTQQILAKRSGLSFSMVSKLERGEQANPSFGTLKTLADALEISPSDLLKNALSIEEQIDEYITYKRGLSQIAESAHPGSCAGRETVGMKNSIPHQERPAAEENSHKNTGTDLNFLRKISAINTIPRPMDSDEDYLSSLRSRPELKRLFSASKNATAEEIERAIEYFESAKA